MTRRTRPALRVQNAGARLMETDAKSERVGYNHNTFEESIMTEATEEQTTALEEPAMIELTTDQITAMERQKSPLRVINPQTGEVFFLIRQEVYALTCQIVGGGRGQAWDDEADDDLIRKTA